MEIWIPGVLALIGALSGVLLSTYLARSTKKQEVRRTRLEEALRAVVLALAARNFATSAGFAGRPGSVTDEDLVELQRRIYLDNIARMFSTLREARQAVAVLVADGIEVGESWRGDEEMQADMERVHSLLLRELHLR